MKMIAWHKSDQNRAAIDPWTVVHFASGLAAGLTEMPLSVALGGAIAYEFIEQYGERRDWGKRFFRVSGPESLSNAVIDVAVFAIGHELGKRWNRT